MALDENSKDKHSAQSEETPTLLVRANREWKRTFDAFADPVMVLDEHCRIVRANKPMIDMLGRAEDEVIGNKCFSLLHGTREALSACPHAQLLADGNEHSTELFEPRLGATFEVRVTPIRDENGLLTGAVHVMRDITRRKQIQEALRQSESTLKTVLQTAPVGIGLLENRTFKWSNDFLSQISGYTQDELLGQDARMLWESDEEFEEAWRAKLTHVRQASPETVESRWKRKDGTVIDTSASWAAIDPQDVSAGIVFAALDVTNRKRAEQALRESEEQYRAVFTNAGIGINVIDRTNKGIAQANPALQNMLGYGEEELLQLTHLDITHPEDRAIAEQRLDSLMSGELDSFSLEKRYLRKDESTVWGQLSVSAIRDSEGNARAAVGMIADITERKRMEIALKESEERLRGIIDSSPTGIIIVQAGKLVYVNPRFVEMIDYETADELLGLPLDAIYVRESKELIVEKAVHTDAGTKIVSHYEVTGSIKSGKRVSLAAWVTDIHHVGEDAYLAFVMDVTESKSLRAQLLQSQKMEAVGTLAGGIAHDFNNLLTVIIGFSEFLLAGKEERDPDRADLQRISEAARNGAELIQRILLFSRRKEIKARPLALNDEVRQVNKLLKRTIPKMIDIELDLSQELDRVNADPSTIEQILLNFAVNAKDAMPEGGKFTVRTRNVVLGEEYCRFHLGAKPGNYVLLSVSDNGHGMEKEILDHIFEPFYTTKEIGRGTGLGLAMVYGIVKQHNGYITCESEPEMGTTFKVYLPAMEHGEQPEVAAETRTPLHGTETVLLVDDEDMIRSLGQRILERHGYTVLSASNGKEALSLYERERNRISLVILDLIMPRLGGWQCLEKLRTLDPRVKVLISSGYASGGTIPEPTKLGAKGFVPKPYDARQMLQTVRKVLDQPH